MTKEQKQEYGRKWYLENKQLTIERAKKWSKEHPDKVGFWKKRWEQNNTEKVNEKSKKWRHKNPVKQASNRMKSLYGIDVEQYNELFKKQNGCCKICGKHQSEFKNRLSIDHCHITEKIRGLLCPNCNRGVGIFYDNPFLLIKAADYIIDN